MSRLEPILDRALLFVLIGVAGLVLVGHYAGPCQDAVHSYGGNIAASLAVYFVVSRLRFPARFRQVMTAGVALAVVELFEASNGFGAITNVYDRVDFVANAVGIALATAIDSITPGNRQPVRESGQAVTGMPTQPSGEPRQPTGDVDTSS